MPKFDFKPGDEAYIVQEEKHRVEGPYRVASIRKGGVNGPQALILESSAGAIAHTDPETAFHDRESARVFALSLVDEAILMVKRNLEILERERSLLLKEPKYLVGQLVWAFAQYADHVVRGPFVVEDIYPHDTYVTYRLKTDTFPYHVDENESSLYSDKNEVKAIAAKVAAERVASAQKALDKAKADEREIVNG